MKILLSCAVLLTAGTVYAEDMVPTDSARVVNMETEIVVTAPKESQQLRRLPVAVSFVSNRELEQTQSHTLKEVSAHVPGFFMPDYGSSLTSSAYIRGIGSRINTPAIGLYVDGVAMNTGSAYDIPMLDVERIDVLRGPQGTLYGRNTMGGLLRVFTRNPFRRPGTDVRMTFSSRDLNRSLALSHHTRLTSHLALSVGGHYQGRRGWQKNAWRDEYTDGKEAGGGRMRLIWLPADGWKVDLGADYSYTDEGGYAYRYLGAENTTEEPYANCIGTIWANNPSTYRRSLLGTHLTVERTADDWVLTSITAYQHLRDRMQLDQDFIGEDFFGLTQKQRIHTWSEELTVRSRSPHRRWHWVGGLYAMHQNLHTGSPVSLTEQFMSTALGEANSYMNRYNWSIDLTSMQSPFVSDGTFKTPTTSLALFHQSTLTDVLLSGLDLTLGLRLEQEWQKMDYNYGGTLHYDLTLNTLGSRPFHNLADEAFYRGDLKRDATQLLPKVALTYRLNKTNNLYASWSKGYRSGGFNVQMFGDLVQAELRSQMMGHVRPDIESTLNMPEFAQMPAFVKQLILSKLTYPVGSPADTYYKPEYSYNYEVGGHFALFGGDIELDVAAFYMDVHDQQLSAFVKSGLGRAMTNAGRGESFGAELSAHGRALNARLGWYASYSYTHSTFKRYRTEGVDYSGNRVPFVPEHQYAVGADYHLSLSHCGFLKGLNFGVNTTGAGRIFWTENNTLRQPFYALLGAQVGLDMGLVKLNLWGKNLTNTRYDTFCFTSSASTRPLKFAQQGRPLQVGLDLRLSF